VKAADAPPAPPAPAPNAAHGDQTLRVRAPISDAPSQGPQFETMHAVADPAAADQAILTNAPAFFNYANYGDVVRVGLPEDDVRPILEVVTASGHRRVMAFTGAHDPSGLVDQLCELFPKYGLRIEGMSSDGDRPHLLVVSVHPDLEPEDVRDAIADWLDDQGATPETASISPPIETQLGPVEW
jgi:hypothetical protein